MIQTSQEYPVLTIVGQDITAKILIARDSPRKFSILKECPIKLIPDRRLQYGYSLLNMY